MSHKFWYLTKMSLFKKIKSKWFLGVNIIFFLAIVILVNMDGIVKFFGGDFENQQTIIILDETKEVANSFTSFLKSNAYTSGENERYEIKITSKEEDEVKKTLEKEDALLIVFQEDASNGFKVKMISQNKINALDYQIFVQAINQVKSNYLLAKMNVDSKFLESLSAPVVIDREVLSDKQDVDEGMETIMSTVFPTIILPFFMLTIFLVQMIGADICEEKSTRSMEVIISNVSAKVHFASKIVAANLFVLIQGGLLLLFVALSFVVRHFFMGGSALSSLADTFGGILNSLSSTGFLDKIWYFLPLLFLLMVASFILYSLLAGILASVTTNMEYFQHIQAPIMIVSVIGYYLAIMAAMFEGSVFIRILSYVPFLSSLLSPALFVLGEVSLFDMVLSILFTVLFIFVFIRYGMRIYKAGILNYSNEKVWTRLFKTVKNKDI